MDDWLNIADLASKFSQVVFFFGTLSLGILTYRNALRGIWSPVNTEYHKRVIAFLANISDELMTEFDRSEPSKAWTAITDEFCMEVKRINEQYVKNKDNIGAGIAVPWEPGVLPWGSVRMFSIQSRLDLLQRRIKSDPFCPDTIRDELCDYCETRNLVYRDVMWDVFRGYMDDLKSGKQQPNDANCGWLWNSANKALNERGCGVDHSEANAHEIRLMIKGYLDSYLQPTGPTARPSKSVPQIPPEAHRGDDEGRNGST